jgi:signal transduction histidine kinase
MDSEVDAILVAAQELKTPFVDVRQLALCFEALDGKNELIKDEIVNVSERAIRQINDLIKLRRLKDGLFEMEPVSVKPICDEVAHELEYLFKYNKRELFIKYSGRTSLAVANREMLKSVVYNFLLNAIHYTGDGVRAELVVRDFGDKVRIKVRDFGPALPIDVWKEMQRGWIEKPTSIVMRPGSSGLGLFIASRFSKYMNANVGATRHRDGTSFFVELNKSKQVSLF